MGCNLSTRLDGAGIELTIDNIKWKIPALVSLGGDSRLMKYERGLKCLRKTGGTSQQHPFVNVTEKKIISYSLDLVCGCGRWDRTTDLKVMGLVSYLLLYPTIC